MEYILVSHWKLVEFDKNVNYLLSRGWKCQGGVSVAVNSNTGETLYAQAMIKEDK